MSEEWKPLSCQDRSCWHIRGPRGIYLSVNSEEAAREIAAKLILFDEMRAALAQLASATRDTLDTHATHTGCCTVTRKSVLKAKAVLSRIDAINQKETP